MRITRTELKKLIVEEIQAALNEEADPSALDSEVFPQKLSQVKPKGARFMSKTGTKDGSGPDDVIGVSHKPQGVAPVGKLKPSQSSMNIEKALGMVLAMLDPSNDFSAGGDLGAFISNDGYIMDGHHRWVATAMIDPTKSVGGYLVDFPGQQLVAVLNTMTKGLFGVQRGKPATGGFDQFTPERMKQQLTKYATSGTKYMKPEQVMQILQKWTGQQGEAAIDAAVQKMAQNVSTLTFDTPAWASGRVDMPVVDDDNVAVAAKALDGGQVNVNPPYKPSGDSI